MQRVIEKADVLIEALPYIQQFRGATVVIKFGGSAMEVKAHHDGILADVAFMECVGMRPVIIHGGGKAISRRMTEKGLEPKFVKGRRVTDAATVAIVEEVIREEINPEIVRTIQAHGGRAERVDGQDVFRVRRMTETDPRTGETLDWGLVGIVESVDTAPILRLLERETIPVVTPLGRGADGLTYNVNADEAAAAAGRALRARKLAYLSDVPGLLRDPKDPESVISTLTRAQIRDLIDRKIIDGGMLPKIQSGLEALEAGVDKIHIVDGRLSHSLLLEIFTDAGVGTEIVK